MNTEITKRFGRSTFAIGIIMFAVTATLHADPAPEGAVTIHTDFPGGNVAVIKHEGNIVHIEPDLRGDSPWFYWYFEARASKPGRVRFVFPEKVGGVKNGAIGLQGPAVSTDAGLTWRTMGTEQVEGNAFFYDFAKPDQRVRFAVAIPYVQADWDVFLQANVANAHVRRSVLTKSRHGREVELLQIGEPGPDVQAVLVTGRHHAAETIASHVLEGFLQEAMSDTPSGEAFRKRYVLFAVPFVDKDGVEEGDQGKNRKPHDHNRDYGEQSIYPEVRAIKELDRAQNFRIALDFHCPMLTLADHQVMYFVGAKVHPQYNFENITEFAGWIKKGLPKTAPAGPMVWLRDEKDPSPKNSRYFGFKEGTIMAATLEIPYSPPGKAMNAADCRRYGSVILQALVNTHFRAADEAK